MLLETDFFFKYHDYYSAIQEQEGLSVLERHRVGIVESLRHNLSRVLLVQGLVSVFALLPARWFVKASAVFCLTNIAATAVTPRFGLPAYGCGFALAGLVTTAVAVYFLIERLRLLHYWTFSRQPFPVPVLVAEGKDSEL